MAGVSINPLQSGEWGVGNGEWGVGSGEWGVGNGEWGVGNMEWAALIHILCCLVKPFYGNFIKILVKCENLVKDTVDTEIVMPLCL